MNKVKEGGITARHIPAGSVSTELQQRIGAKILTNRKSFADWVRDHATAADSLDP